MPRLYLLTLLLLGHLSIGHSQSVRQRKQLDDELVAACSDPRPDGRRIANSLRAGANPNARDPNGASALMWLALRGDYDSFLLLIKNGADPRINGMITPGENLLGSLVTAAIFGGRYFHHDYRILKWLVEAPEIPIDRQDYFPKYGKAAYSPLHAAASYGELAALKLLLDQKGKKPLDVNIRCEICNRRTPLIFAAERKNEPDFCRLLLESGADPSLRDDQQQTAYDHARVSGGPRVTEVLANYRPMAGGKAGYLPATPAEGLEQGAHQAMISGDSVGARVLYSRALSQKAVDFEIDLLEGFEFVRLSESVLGEQDIRLRERTEVVAGMLEKQIRNLSVEAWRKTLNFPDSARNDLPFDRLFPLYGKLGRLFPDVPIHRIDPPATTWEARTVRFARESGRTLPESPLRLEFAGDRETLELSLFARRLDQPQAYAEALLRTAREHFVRLDTVSAEKYWQKALDFADREWKTGREEVALAVVRGYVQAGKPAAARSVTGRYLFSDLTDESFATRLARGMLGGTPADRKSILTELLKNGERLSSGQRLELHLLLAESFEDELDFAGAAAVYRNAVSSMTDAARSEPIGALVCYKVAWCYFQAGDFDRFMRWQRRAAGIRKRLPLWSGKPGNIAGLAEEYRGNSHRLDYRSIHELNRRFFARQEMTAPETLPIAADLLATAGRAEWLLDESKPAEAILLIDSALSRWNRTPVRPATWIRIQLLKARALRMTGRQATALLATLEKETVSYCGLFSDWLSEVYFEQLEGLHLERNKSAMLAKVKEMNAHQRLRQQQIPAFLLDPGEYELYRQINRKYTGQLTATAVELSSDYPELTEMLFDQALLNKGLQLLGDRILRSQVYYTLQSSVEKLKIQITYQARAENKKRSPEEREYWRQKAEEAKLETQNQREEDDLVGKIFFELNLRFGKISEDYRKDGNVAAARVVSDMQYRPMERLAVQRMGKDLRPYFSRRWKDIRSVLKPDEALVEFIQVPTAAGEQYLALIVRQSSDRPRLVTVCTGTQLADLLAEANGEEKGINRLYSSGSLTDAIWKPLVPHLTGVAVIRYVPVGLLHRLSFEGFVPDGYRLSRMLTSQELRERETWFSVQGQRKFSLWGGIDYGKTTGAASVRGVVPSRSRGERGGNWEALPGAAREVKTIRDIIRDGKEKDVTLFQGTKATEEAFRSRKHIGRYESPEILHLATHGFFYPVYARHAAPGSAPLMRSGVVLANGNRVPAGDVATGQPDGILTAQEIADLDFVRTRLVVLSACETGLGDIKTDEGVYGLQRAFKMAGARYVVMSLWKVPDPETARMMDLFYRVLMKDPEFDVQKAFDEARNQMKKEYPSPYYWASFVLTR